MKAGEFLMGVGLFLNVVAVGVTLLGFRDADWITVINLAGVVMFGRWLVEQK